MSIGNFWGKTLYLNFFCPSLTLSKKSWAFRWKFPRGVVKNAFSLSVITSWKEMFFQQNSKIFSLVNSGYWARSFCLLARNFWLCWKNFVLRIHWNFLREKLIFINFKSLSDLERSIFSFLSKSFPDELLRYTWP